MADMGSTPETRDKILDIGALTRYYISNICFLVSAALWFQGFFYYTQVSLDAGADMRTIGPLMMKLLASALFTIQPMTSLMRLPTTADKSTGGFYWANFYAILLFHIGNMISTSVTFKNYKFFDLFSPSNQPTMVATISFMLGTTFLLAGDAKSIEQVGGGEYPKALAIAYPFIGEAFLLIGSVVLMVYTNNN